MHPMRCRDDMKTSIKKFQAGFTLVEAVVVIVITGIIAAVVAVFIRAPVQGYFDSVARAELTDVADTALRRMTRDLRLALPNSIRTGTNGTDQYVEFLMTSSGGRYLDEDDSLAAGDMILDFNNGANLSFDVIGPPPAIVPRVDHIVVYNLGPGMAPADAYQGGNRALVDSVAGNRITLVTNPFAAQSPSMRSPGRRFQVVTTPVTYGCENNTIIRSWGYPIVLNQSLPPAGAGLQSALLATGVTGCAFSYTNLANVRSGLVGISITLQRNNETITLFQQVHVDNTP
jgi:MSHA biogenesis protein MshO